MKPWFLGYRGHCPWEGVSWGPAGEVPGKNRGLLLPNLSRGGILKGAMETRIRPDAKAGIDRLMCVKRTRWAANSAGSGLITVQIFIFRDNPLKHTDPDGRSGYNTILKAEGLKQPIPNETALSEDAKKQIGSEGWSDITKDQESRTEAEGSSLRGENGMPLSDITGGGSYRGAQYAVYPMDPETGNIPKRPYKQYFDMDGNGRIDFKK